jgi:hypothetical protein
MYRRNFRIRNLDDLDSEEVLADGEGLRVPLNLADSVSSRILLTDASPYAGHRPMPVRDALAGQQQRDSIDADDHCSLEQRRGISLADAQALRDEAFANLCKRSESAWKGNRLAGDSNGNNNSDPDENEPPEPGDEDALAEAMRKRDEAFAALERRSQNAWRTSQAKATATELQAERWRGGK